MLNLMLKEGEFLIIGDDIKLVLQRTTAAGNAYVAISAPKSVEIRRGEVYEKELAGQAAHAHQTPESTAAAENLRVFRSEKEAALAQKRQRLGKNQRRHFDETHQFKSCKNVESRKNERAAQADA